MAAGFQKGKRAAAKPPQAEAGKSHGITHAASIRQNKSQRQPRCKKREVKPPVHGGQGGGVAGRHVGGHLCRSLVFLFKD